MRVFQDPTTGAYFREDGRPGHACTLCGNGYATADAAEPGAHDCVGVTDRLEYLRGEIRAERISQGEVSELQGLVPFIDRGDVELLEWAGVPEFEDVADDDA